MFLKRFFNFIPRNDYSRALDLFNEGHYRKALKLFEDLLAGHRPGDDLDVGTVELFACESHVALSQEHRTQGDAGEALREMEIAVGLKPNFADLRFTLANLYLEGKRYDDARENLMRALDINPRYFKAGVNLARVHHLSGASDEAIEALEAQRPNCPGFYRDGLSDLMQMMRINQDGDTIEKAFHALLEERPSSAQISREVAIEAIQNGNYTEAIRELKKAVALKPDYPDLHNYLGIAYGNKGMSDDAIEEFETALKINPYYMKARLNLALALYECGRYLEAQNHIERVLSVKPDNQLAKNLLDELKSVTNRK
jgi:protein O-GlcNAc transferase